MNESMRKRPVWPIAVLVTFLLLVWLAFWQRDRIAAWFASGEEPTEVAAVAPVEEPAPPEVEAPESLAETRWREVTGVAPSFATEEIDCAAVEAEREALCSRLDARAEAEGLTVAPGACARLDAALSALEATRPVLAGESRNPSTMLANAMHLFRVAGRGEVGYAARLLRLESDAVEPIAATLYRSLDCRGDDALLYDYAAFGFTTLGGQAYLRRRSPRAEALAGFYGVLVIDRADREQRNSAGIDPRRELARVRELISGQPLLFRDRYLDELDAIEARWSSR